MRGDGTGGAIMAADRAEEREKKTIGISKQTDERDREREKEKGRRAVTKRHWAPGQNSCTATQFGTLSPLEY